jgi:hypothetical protein
MTNTRTPKLIITLSAEAVGENLPQASQQEIWADGINRLQGSLVGLLKHGIQSGIFTYQDRSPIVNLNWSITLDDGVRAEPVSRSQG